eukprot:Hpha_TRINITY_DN15119_c6_g1::TRINITY_DN15119_c6_g1_i4::g.126794::m.126794
MFGCRWDWLVRQGDTPDEVKIKSFGFPFCLVIFLSNVFVIIVVILQEKQEIMRLIGNVVIAFANLQFMGGVVATAVPAGYLADVLLMGLTVGVFGLDIAGFAISSPFRAWAFVVLVLDIALVFKRYHMPRFIIPFVLVYQAALQVESVSKFGLTEVGYWGTKGTEINSCSCASPPCDIPPVTAFINLLNVSIVFLGDFYFTNGFASGMMLQLRKVEASV